MPALVPPPALARMMVVLALGGAALGLLGCDGGGSSAEPPSPPTNVQATAQEGAVTLTWTGSPSASGYKVYRTTSSGSGTSGTPLNGDAPIGSSEFSDPSVENGTQYFYRVTAVGDGGESSPSAEVSVRPFPSPPSRPTTP